MLAETYKTSDVTRVVPAAEEALPRLSASYLSRSAQFLAILAQFALIVVAIHSWQFESELLDRLMCLALVGFVIHHFLPLWFRLPFFAMLSLLAVITGLGHLGPNMGMAWLTGKITTSGLLYLLVPGLAVIGIGLGLIGICHLPIRFGAQVGLLAVAGAGLAF